MALLFLAQLGILAASLIASYYLTPRPSSPKAGPDVFAIPRAEEGATVPLVYGTVRVRSPLVVEVGDAHPFDLVSDGVVVGSGYEVGLRMILCCGNAAEDATTGGATLVGLFAGDKRIEGIDASSYTPGVGCTAWNVYDSSIFADSPGMRSGAIGTAFLYGGRWDQTVSAADVIDDWEQTQLDLGTDLRTPYRGYVVLAFRGTSVGGWTTDGPNLPAYQPVIHNPVAIPGYESTTGPIGGAGGGDANPAAVLYDLLTNHWGRLGFPAAEVDAASFADAAATLAVEGHGISLYLTDAQSARDAIADILKQIDAVIYEEPTTGTLALRLIRDDYVTGDLFVANSSTMVGIDWHAATWADAPTAVVVNFTDASRGWIQGSEYAQNPAALSMGGDMHRPASYDYRGVTSRRLAAEIAARELALVSVPLLRATITLTAAAYALRPGDAIRVVYAPWGIDTVMRVYNPDGGTIEDGRIVVEAVQDRFAVARPVFYVDAPAELPATPRPIEDRIVVEAPRWIADKGALLGYVGDADQPRAYVLAAPASDAESRHRWALDDASDSPSRTFPGRFVVDDSYARTSGPYDTTVGLQIRDVKGWTPTAATAAQIAAEGVNVIQIGTELLAFESATDAGGGIWTLGNVWRGILDTVPRDHEEGAVGYVLPGRFGLSALGRTVLTHGTTYETATLAALGSTWTPIEVAPLDDLAVASRALRPLSPDEVEINGAQSPAALTEDGVTIIGLSRDRLNTAIRRPDLASETPETGTTYAAVAYADGHPADGATRVTLATGYDETDLATGIGPLGTGAAGHGTIEIGAEGRRSVTIPGATSATELGSYQPATVPVVAHHYRNLLLNPRFSSGASGWTATTGTMAPTTDAAGLGGGGSYLTTASATLVAYQDVAIGGYLPGGYGLRLRFAAGPTTGDADDTVSVVATSRNAAGTVLDTATYAATHPTTWGWQELTIASLHADTATIRVAVTLAAVGELDTGASVGVTGFRLGVGQITSQLLTNASFESGFTGWTQSSGTWQQMTGPLYGSANWARPNNGSAATLYQDVTPPAGYEADAVAVLELGRVNDDASDTGTVTITARDSGGTTLATATTGAEAISPTNVWQRRILFLDLPAGTATIRVQCDAARVAGTPLNAGFDDLDLTIHKDLAVDESRSFDFSSARHTQALPATRFEWMATWPTVAIPNLAILAGAAVGGLGTEPLIEAVGIGVLGARCVIDRGDRYGMTAAGFEIPGITTAATTSKIRVAPAGSSFANFGKASDWAVLVAVRWSTAAVGTQVPIAMRFSGGVGWRLQVSSTGYPFARVDDVANTASVTAANKIDDGDWAILGMHYDASADLLSIVDRSGVLSASTAGVTEWLLDDTERMYLLSGPDGLVSSSMPGQVARCYLWQGSATPTAAALAGCITTHARPSAWGALSYTRAAPVACVTGSDATGVLVETFGPARVATAKLGAARGLAAVPDVTSLVGATWSGWASAGGTITDAAATDPRGLLVACAIVGTSTQGRYVSVDLGTSGETYYVRLLLRSTGAHAVRVALDSSGGTVVDSEAVSVTSTWAAYTVALSWDGAGTGRLRIAGSNTGTAGTVYISPLICLATTAPGEAWALSTTTSAQTTITGDTSALSTRLISEGEIEASVLRSAGYADGTIARLHNGANGNDERQIRWLSSSETVGAHATGAASVSSTAIDASSVAEASPSTIRLRWCRAGLADGVSSEYVAIRHADNLGSVRTATWTGGTTALDVLDLGHDDGSGTFAGLIGAVTVRAREAKL